MQNILFSHSYFLRFDPKQWEAGEPYAPLGTLYAASVMREKGYQVSLFDSMFARTADEVLAVIEKQRPDFFVIYDDGFNYLTKMCLTNMRTAAFRMCRLAREFGCTVIVSGSDSTDHFEKYLREGADFILIGEAESTLLELITAINTKQTSYAGIPGLAFADQGSIVKTPARQVLRNLDALPFPAWDLVDMEAYRETWMNAKGYFSINMGTTRGCPFKCNWCAKPIYGNRYNSRSPANVVKELTWLKNKYAFDHVWFCDDIFGLKPGWVNEFADLVEREGLSFRFKIQSRADLLVQENYVKALKRAGCDNVWLGAESGSQKILDAMDKGTTIEQIYTATRLLRKNNIKPSFFIQFGYLGETIDDIRQTIRMINELLPHTIGISVSYPLPGTVFYEKVKEDLGVKSNWTDSDELQLMFKNTYRPAFYKQLHRYVHAHFHRIKAGADLEVLFKQPRKLSLSRLDKILKLPWYFLQEWVYRQKLEAVK